MEKQKILIAILSKENWIRGEFLDLIQDLERRSSDPGYPYVFQLTTVVGFKPLAAYAHNEACRRAIELNADWLWFWSDDMIPLPESLNLLDYLDQADILGGTVYNVVGDPPRLCVMTVQLNNGQPVWAPTHATAEPYEPHAMGSGGMLVSRRVLMDDSMMTDHWSDPTEPPPFFQDIISSNMRRLRGHDVDFTHRAKKKGWRLLTVPAATFDHYKGVGLTAMARMISLGWKRCYDGPNSKED